MNTVKKSRDLYERLLPYTDRLPDRATSEDLHHVYGGSFWDNGCGSGDVYILSIVGYNEFSMISLKDGNRFSSPKGAQEFVQYHNDFRRFYSFDYPISMLLQHRKRATT